MAKWIQLEQRTVNCVIEPYYVASFSQAVFLISKHPHSSKTETGGGGRWEEGGDKGETSLMKRLRQRQARRHWKRAGGYPIRRCKPGVSAEFNSLTKWMAYWIRHTQECMFHTRKKQQVHVKSTMGKRSRNTKNKYSRPSRESERSNISINKVLETSDAQAVIRVWWIQLEIQPAFGAICTSQ